MDTFYPVQTPAPYSSPETVLLNGRIRRTVDDGSPVEAIAIHQGTIVASGTTAEIRGLAGSGSAVADLRGRWVLPSFVDSHTHFHRAAILRHLFLDFDALGPRSIGDVVAHVRGRAGGLTAGTWIQGDSLSIGRLAEGRLPDRRELDAAAPDHPVLLRGIGKHVVAANSLALAAAGITRETLDPPGGRIERDERGEPSGILHERAKLRLDTSHPETVVPGTSEPDRRRALRAGVGELHRLGITTIHEMIRLPEEADDLTALHADGDLGVRVRLFYRVHETPITLDHLVALGIRRGIGDDWLRILGVKISVDGWCIFRNAAVYEPYRDEPDNLGIMRIDPGELATLAAAANRQGLTIAIHAVGPRAVDAALDAFAGAGPAVAGPHRLEHAHLDLDDVRLARIRDLGLVLSAQPGFLPAYRRDWEAALPADRVDRMMPLRSAQELGIPIILNSDVPSGPLGPLAAIHAAVTRQADGRTIGPDQAISRLSAWRGWTTLPSASAGEAHLGSLDIGRRADLVVFDEDPLADAADLLTLSVSATMIDGRFVHGADGVTG
jgi:predicted amidohydrolase YtcJ